MSDFDRWAALLQSFEGGRSDRAEDRGGATAFGITETLLDRLHWRGKYQDIAFATMTVDDARRIAQAEFWEAFAVLPWPLSLVMADWAFNSGPSHAVEALQTEVGATIDGQLGPDTVDKALRVLGIVGASMLAGAVHRRRGQFLSHLVKHDPTQVANLGGWIDRLIRIGLLLA